MADERKRLASLESEYAALIGGEDTKSILEERIELLEAQLEDITERYEKLSEEIRSVESKIDTAEGLIEDEILEGDLEKYPERLNDIRKYLMDMQQPHVKGLYLFQSVL